MSCIVTSSASFSPLLTMSARLISSNAYWPRRFRAEVFGSGRVWTL